MTPEQYNTAQAIRERIIELTEEITALFDAKDKRIKPAKPFICHGFIRSSHFAEDKEITLTKQDIRVLQAIRQAECDQLEKILKEL